MKERSGLQSTHSFLMSDSEKERKRHAVQRFELALENSDLYPAVKWATAQNPSVCDFGRRMQGKQFLTTDPLWPRCLPPIHSGCTCLIWPQMEDRIRNVERLESYFNEGAEGI